jgi:hypothetical protein
MSKFNYPADWKDWSPLERDNWHRRMGAMLRRVRFAERYHQRFGHPWRMVWRDGAWREPLLPQWYFSTAARIETELAYDMKVVMPNLGLFFMDPIVY